MHRFGLIFVLLVMSAPPASGQDVVSFLREQRFLTRAHELIRQHGERPVPRTPVPVPLQDAVLADRLARMQQGAVPATDTLAEAHPRDPFEAHSVRLVKKLERAWFSRTFEHTEWAFLGSNHITSLDTTLTWRLRAALEAAYGSPTQTLVEVSQEGPLTLSTAIEFEYWFIVNDTIPLIVTDVSGPLDRGLVLSTDQQLRHRLPDLRDAIFDPLVRSPRLAAFADYYFDVEGKRWYLAGYDGRRFVLRATPRPPLRTRPLPDALRR